MDSLQKTQGLSEQEAASESGGAESFGCSAPGLTCTLSCTPDCDQCSLIALLVSGGSRPLYGSGHGPWLPKA